MDGIGGVYHPQVSQPRIGRSGGDLDWSNRKKSGSRRIFQYLFYGCDARKEIFQSGLAWIILRGASDRSGGRLVWNHRKRPLSAYDVPLCRLYWKGFYHRRFGRVCHPRSWGNWIGFGETVWCYRGEAVYKDGTVFPRSSGIQWKEWGRQYQHPGTQAGQGTIHRRRTCGTSHVFSLCHGGCGVAYGR